MPEKVIPVTDYRFIQHPPSTPSSLAASSVRLMDSLGRSIQDLRISVTDRCNFRCQYCMPKEIFDQNYVYLPHSNLLSFEEIFRLARLFVAQGVRKIRLTGGEPLLRKHLEKLIEMLSALTTPDGHVLDLALTTNGSLLAKKAQSLKDAGLRRVTVSLDALNEVTFQRMNDVNFPASEVLHGINVAHRIGLGPIKINMVVKAGINDHEIVPMARHFKGTSFIVRFIEYMDVGVSNGWKMDEVVPSAEVLRRIHAAMPLENIDPNYVGETAGRWRYVDGEGEIGVISSVTQAFCQECSRARLSTEGQLYTCLFASRGHDLRALLRNGCSDMEITSAISNIWQARADRYSELRNAHVKDLVQLGKKIEMSYIGG